MTDMTQNEYEELLAQAKKILNAAAGSLPEISPPSIPPALEALRPNAAHESRGPTFPWRAILFDVYGTLLSSLSGDIADAWTWQRGSLDALARECAKNCTGEELKAYFSSAVKGEHLKGFAQTPYPEVRAEELWDEFPARRESCSARELALRFELAVNPVRPMPGLERLMGRLKESSLPVGIISNAQFYTPISMAAFDASPDTAPFSPDLCFWSFVYREAKPAPALFEHAKAALLSRGISPRDCLFVGNDLLNDIYAADQMGFSTALFAGDAASLRLREGNPVCTGVLPDLCLASLDELTSLIPLSQAGG